jgi:hypothetical protein
MENVQKHNNWTTEEVCLFITELPQWLPSGITGIELKRMREEAVMAYFKVLFRRTEKKT